MGNIEDIKMVHLVQPDRYHIACKQGGTWYIAHTVVAQDTHSALEQINQNEQARGQQLVTSK